MWQQQILSIFSLNCKMSNLSVIHSSAKRLGPFTLFQPADESEVATVRTGILFASLLLQETVARLRFPELKTWTIRQTPWSRYLLEKALVII
jgi:hypothetical protein